MKLINVVLEEKLIVECMKVTRMKNQKALIDHALRELLRHKREKT